MPDWENAPGSQRRSLGSFIFEDGPEGWCFKHLNSYAVELLEFSPRQAGLPVGEARLQLLLARRDCASADDLKAAAHVARALFSKLPCSSVQELMLLGGMAANFAPLLCCR